MLTKLKLIGALARRTEPDDPLGLNRSLEQAMVLEVCFQRNGDQWEYRGLTISEYDPDKAESYLLKNVKGNAVSPFPTIYWDARKAPKKLQRILKACATVNPTLQSLLESWVNSENEIVAQANATPDADTKLMTIKLDGKLPGDSPYFGPIIAEAKEEQYRDYFYKYNAESKAQDKLCYICGKRASEVWGFVSTFSFYSANELAPIAGGFQKEKAWRNYPVCPECAADLKAARKYLEKYLRYNFYGFSYFLIPSPVITTKALAEILEILREDYDRLQLKESAAQSRARMTNAENEVFELLAEQQDTASFSLFFFKAAQSEFKILLEIQDILPSRFQKLFEAKAWVESFEIFHDLKGIYKKTQVDNLRFDFGILRNFWPGPNFDKPFLELTGKIFLGKSVNMQFLLQRIHEHICGKFTRQEIYQHDVLKGFMLLLFMEYLGLFPQTKHLTNTNREVLMSNDYERFFDQYPGFFDSDVKKALFLEGVLAQYLLNIQYQERQATPFRHRLNGLKLDARIVKRILPEMIDKLESYGKNYYRHLEELIAHYLLTGEPDLNKMTIPEISFYFVMGMSLANQFKPERENLMTEEVIS